MLWFSLPASDVDNFRIKNYHGCHQDTTTNQPSPITQTGAVKVKVKPTKIHKPKISKNVSRPCPCSGIYLLRFTAPPNMLSTKLPSLGVVFGAAGGQVPGRFHGLTSRNNNVEPATGQCFLLKAFNKLFVKQQKVKVVGGCWYGI